MLALPARAPSPLAGNASIEDDAPIECSRVDPGDARRPPHGGPDPSDDGDASPGEASPLHHGDGAGRYLAGLPGPPAGLPALGRGD
eukprot:15467348-Alexandrium_andersonii.AAC.1